ncbi:hypothetical protein NDI45_28500 [Leptolyngbya sp. GB1-A1]|uniref:hypothetical protein n=1 Tax=Leptolyngbya sp. GB1-A1 TaxID=2933908 RepID=UPI003298EEA9
MTVEQFAKAIEHLLIGAIRGKAIMRLHHLLMSFELGRVGADVLQKEIDQHDSDRLQP